MAKKFYVVWAGHQPGVYDNWPEAKRQVDGYSGARYQSFRREGEAQQAFAGGDMPAPDKPKHTAPAADLTSDYTFYCDGGCEPNPGKAGSGLAIYRQQTLIQLWYGMFNPNGTNNSAELHALYQALVLAEKVINQHNSAQIYCDSMYAIQCVRDWAPGWEKRGWKRKDGDIQNLDIIQQAYAVFNRIKDKLRLSHVKAHAGTEGNELADRMTMVAVDRQPAGWQKYEPQNNGEFDIKSLLKMRAG